jgi:hypothetical protein
MIDDENQTVFAQDEPMIEAGNPAPADSPNGEATPVKPRMSTAKFALLLGGIMLVLLILVAAVAKSMPQRQVAQMVPSPSPSPVTQAQTDLQTTFALLHEDVVNADPSVNDLPVPPIDFKLNMNATK